MSETEVLSAAIAANQGGFNETVPMTRRKVILPEKQLRKDSDIAKELIFLWDVKKNGPAMVSAFVENRHRLSHNRYWELLRTVWIAGGERRFYPIFRQMFASKRPWKKFLMTPEEEAFFKKLPDEFTVYRAAYGKDDGGLSWSLMKEWVDEYAKVHDRIVIERTVKKSEVTAFFDRRGEYEIVIL
jgi:hypothetical protein